MEKYFTAGMLFRPYECHSGTENQHKSSITTKKRRVGLTAVMLVFPFLPSLRLKPLCLLLYGRLAGRLRAVMIEDNLRRFTLSSYVCVYLDSDMYCETNIWTVKFSSPELGYF